jgi:uncharacterized protein (TIGR00730 family)
LETTPRAIRSVTVYCASSRRAHPAYTDAARRLGAELARHGAAIVYGGSILGLMGALADGALEAGGRVIGVLPRFMSDLEWGHPRLSELRLVDDMHERKRLMAEGTDAIVALPGGCGTLEELFEAITWKRLGIYVKPIVLVNVRGFFDPCLELLSRCVEERFMDERHRAMWSVVEGPEQVLDAIRGAPPWTAEARGFAAI